MKISVVAAQGLRVPLADNPHEYIEQEPVAVDDDEVYYRRLLADGDLLVVQTDRLPEAAQQITNSKKGKTA
ncbi:MAG: DUF2635 domain-containing protein [Alysiella sp.]|uniref:DUF2635 domain-containing protein n=1 Tax=Alysiella sp. TaxID=1872483 RepID=UPI0026DB5AB4|nr:DUF2635 domain-containing protein [Alysiella sp.]MDO4434391.1 DUF2635 domain-containing protein [Alysiella sp.]